MNIYTTSLTRLARATSALTLLAAASLSAATFTIYPDEIEVNRASLYDLGDVERNVIENLFDGDSATGVVLTTEDVFLDIRLVFNTPVDNVLGFSVESFDLSAFDPRLAETISQITTIAYTAYDSYGDRIGSESNFEIPWNDQGVAELGLNGAHPYASRTFDDVSEIQLQLAGSGETPSNVAIGGFSFAATPEPSTALLTLLTGSFVLLRRKR